MNKIDRDLLTDGDCNEKHRDVEHIDKNPILAVILLEENF